MTEQTENVDAEAQTQTEAGEQPGYVVALDIFYTDPMEAQLVSILLTQIIAQAADEVAPGVDNPYTFRVVGV